MARRAKLKARRADVAGDGLSILFCCFSTALVMTIAVWIVFQSGSTLRFGDAEAHLNIARRIIDSRTPGWAQVGTTWLPLPHLLMLPLVRIDSLWTTGLAGAITSAVCMTVATSFLFAAVQRLLGSTAAAASSAVFLLNPNTLYLGSIPMTESVFFAALFALLYCSLLPGWGGVIGAGFAALAGSLTRYEAWFLLPFTALYILFHAEERRWVKAIVFSCIAGAGPLLWFAHNWFYFSDPLYFYRGPYSAIAIQGNLPYPGRGNWRVALQYYGTAAQLLCGWPVFVMGLAGCFAAWSRRVLWPLFLLALPPAFYVWSIHSSSTPIHIPTLAPFSYYNTRYALALLPLAAFGCAGLARFGKPFALVVIVVSLSPFLLHPGEPPLTWKESEENSKYRREWVRQASEFLLKNAAPGDTYFTSFNDITAIYRTLGVPLRHTLTGDMNPDFSLAELLPSFYLHEDWAVVMGGDHVQGILDKTRLKGPRYDLAARIVVKYSQVIEIYQRYETPVLETARREK